MKGKITSWKDDKGFGFISTDEHSENIFFHISSIKKAIRKPEVGDQVIFDAAKDSQGRLKATHVLLEGVPLENLVTSKNIVIAPVKNDTLDYFIYSILTILFGTSLTLYFKTGVLESAFIPGIFFIVILFFLLNRKKQPVSKSFSCSKCHSISNHDQRTVQAWNKGFDRLYCKSCHQKWLYEQPKEYSSTKSGCLGVLIIVAIIPIFYMAGTIARMVQG